MSEIYLVGGSVRDRLLHLPVADHDWVVVGATPDELLALGYQQVGKDFPVFLHPITKEEYALARTERKSGKGYTGFICDFSEEITLEQDLIRRDLTINAIAMDENGNIIDPYHGVDDIKKKILRHVSPAFREDPLRILRVARFAARFYQLGFTVAPQTLDLMKQMVFAGEISYLTAERIWKETEKALSAANPQVYFQVLEQCGAFTLLFPSLNLSNNIIDALKQSALLTDDLTIRFAVLCAQLPNKSVVEALCKKIKAPNNYTKIAIMVQQYRHDLECVQTLTAEQIVSLLNSIDVWRNPLHLDQLIIAGQAFAKTTSFSQANYLKEAYNIASHVNVQHILAEGYTGKQIHIELQKRRIEALLNWI
ncbi:multifunctional CCA tRNA nucleotidyl transferase/2'3'-cyclic phosphodiesterase/2'nucleotidase/phosphatase [Gilliamella sp. Pas-s95]|uniref:multifunctional CCA tRNA nucleotidyl transferase/2'3'-cyclic phosphodiesterase/2'nucleotidase/phosphatase n=1 Tax=Gilliamella sp. Pas-s95 TaxID=2687317 RepID=UPI0013249B8E|nr:multifunctional CCA tRNA nucleotidyl transferase/2'3'-cyclic phosphodiesterase/2'nucleotidase/phosphatase [Gilliamella sp. Pas-s95]MWN04930.1 multifunctional CCA tRNA nucleotidyl transferase/2'3'-cyclic phosphodiesterase/2'nucleotidase/phosphatase [Gilliamella sp. Pas-s95]